MSQRIYISADYALYDGDREVVDTIKKWNADNLHKIDFVDMAAVSSGSVANDPDCRPCDLKKEFNRQINASSSVIIIIGDKTSSRTAGSNCNRSGNSQFLCSCTPYKQNSNGEKVCKVTSTSTPGPNDDFGSINSCSYIRHEFEQAKKRKKNIIVFYNSTRYESHWLPNYMREYENIAIPFWKIDRWGDKVGDYDALKKALGYV